MPDSPKIESRRQLLQIAREAIRCQITKDAFFPAELPEVPEASGVFVTVRVSGALRGCIGFLDIRGGLIETVANAARRAAANDSRFNAITADEYDDTSVEITLLGPQEAIDDAKDFELGRHGLILEYHYHRGLLLPQVPVERGWTAEEFLSALCQKAGVADHTWEKPDARLWRFEGTVIDEDWRQDS